MTENEMENQKKGKCGTLLYRLLEPNMVSGFMEYCMQIDLPNAENKIIEITRRQYQDLAGKDEVD